MHCVSTHYFYNILEMNNLYTYRVETQCIASPIITIKYKISKPNQLLREG
jgi:hypothetical protein